MNQVGQQGDAAGQDVDRSLDQRGRAEDAEREPDGAQACPRAPDARVDETV
jgi:hypothetical protein